MPNKIPNRAMKQIRFLLWIVGLFSILPILGQNPIITKTIKVNADAFVDGRSSSTNYGADGYLYASTINVSGETYAKRSYLKADLSSIPSTANVISGMLNIYGFNQALGTTSEMQIEKVTSSWTEMGLCYSNQPSVSSSGSRTLNYTGGGNKVEDITSFAQAWVTDPSANYGVRLRLSSEVSGNSYSFFSKENSFSSNLSPTIALQYIASPLYMSWNTMKNLGEGSTGGITKQLSSTSTWEDMMAVSWNELGANTDGFILHQVSYSNDYVRIGFSSGFEQTSDKMDFCFEICGNTLRLYRQGIGEAMTINVNSGAYISMKRVGSYVKVYVNDGSSAVVSWSCNPNLSYKVKLLCKRNSGSGEIGSIKTSFERTEVLSTYIAQPSADYNYIYSVTPLIAVMSLPAKTVLKEIGNYIDKIDYFDGLGRPLQNVIIKNTPAQHSTYSFQLYDELGRENIQYLPYVLNTLGQYDNNATSNQSSFYTSGASAGIPFSQSAYSETVYDNSPLNRVVEQGGPDSWKIEKGTTVPYVGYLDFMTKKAAGEVTGEYTANTKKIVYATNVSYEVSKYVLNGNTLNTGGEPYSGGTLYKTIQRDENWSSSSSNINVNSTVEYKDKEGKVVLKRSYDDTGSELNTYYVYDDFGLLRYVLSPEAIAKLTTGSYTPDHPIIKSLCYYYEYDGRKRMTIKQLPGADPVYMVYNKRDQLVATQDGNQRAMSPKQWTFTKYDALGRPILTGYASFDNSIQEVQSLAYNQTKTYEERGGSLLGYTNNAFPVGTMKAAGEVAITDLNVYSATYYDDYTYGDIQAFDNTYKYDTYRDVEGNSNYFNRVTGKVTGTMTRVLDDMNLSNWMINTMYYDDKGRVIQSLTKYKTSETNNQKLFGAGFFEVISNKYDFTGHLLVSCDKQTLNGATLGSGTTSEIKKYYVYDHAGRLKQTYSQVTGDNDNAIVLESELTYNELGQMTRKILHKNNASNNVQDISYAYNIRGWLTQINDPTNLGTDAFAMKLCYENVSGLYAVATTAQFNGNISGMVWTSKNTSGANNVMKGYGYTYDALNRLKTSKYGDGSYLQNNTDAFNESIGSYDKNGNIISLSRSNFANGLIDNLDYTYQSNSNRLAKVTDAGNKTVGFIDGSNADDDYAYDSNGNLIKDINTGGSSDIKYNHLDLPYDITLGNGDKIKYIYDANGNRLKTETTKTGTVSSRYYLASFEYDNAKLLSLIRSEEGQITKASTGEFAYEYHLKDHLGNVRAVVGTNGTVSQSVDYYPFGMMHEANFGSSINKYMYNGKENQHDNGLDWYYYGARFYDPQIARWNVVDPLAERIPELTPYNYVRNNPINLTDPDGRADDKERVYNPNSNKTINRSHNTTASPLVSRSSGTITVSQKDTWGMATNNNVRINGSNANLKNISSKSATVIANAMVSSGESSLKVTSTVRTPEQDANAMYDNAKANGVAHEKALYAKTGDQVIDVFQAHMGDKKEVAVAAMVDKINDLGPYNVSHHEVDPSVLNVIDISPKSLNSVKTFQNNLSTTPGVSKLFPYPKDPAVHVEIPQ